MDTLLLNCGSHDKANLVDATLPVFAREISDLVLKKQVQNKWPILENQTQNKWPLDLGVGVYGIQRESLCTPSKEISFIS